MCYRNGTDCCSEKEFSFCTTEEEQGKILDAVFNAAIKAGVNVQQYQWGQKGLNSNPSGPVRRQETDDEVTITQSPDDGNAA